MLPRPDIEVKDGDLVLARANGVLDLVGRTALIRTTPRGLMLSDKLLRLRPDERRLLKPYLHLVMRLEAVRRQIVGTTGGSDMRNVTQSALRALLVPLPSLKEQETIGAAFDAFEERERRENGVAAALQALKSAVMTVLLTGELRVTPDPEPA
jgi:type I restriction enzyme S subunit